MEIRYRDVPLLHDHFALSATLSGIPAPSRGDRSPDEGVALAPEGDQPVAASAGCIFENPRAFPPENSIEELGLKNCSVGGARVSEVHGNFIVNDGGATAAEILSLIARIRYRARTERGIELETEVQILGEDPVDGEILR